MVLTNNFAEVKKQASQKVRELQEIKEHAIAIGNAEFGLYTGEETKWYNLAGEIDKMLHQTEMESWE